MTKVFCIGFHKTGTNSLGDALTYLGYKVCGVRHDLLPFLEKNDNIKTIEIVDEFDAFKDNPWSVLFKNLDELYPGSKFILTIRDETTWIQSIVNHFDSTPSEMIRFIYGIPYPTGYEELFIRRYREHNDQVQAYFRGRPDDFLLLKLEEEPSWNKLCAFLDKPVPSIPFPHTNKGAYSRYEKWKKNILKMLRGRLQSFRNPDAG